MWNAESIDYSDPSMVSTFWSDLKVFSRPNGTSPSASGRSTPPLTCPVGATECAVPATTEGLVRCCAAANATCCNDGAQCCPKGYICQPRSEAHPARCEAVEPDRHPYAVWQPQWNTCEGPLQTYRLNNVTGTTTASQPSMFLQYFSSGGDLVSLARSSCFRAAVVVVHGANRNADEYFCAMKEAAALQGQYPPEEVLVVAPWFKAWPPDSVLANEVYWWGGDPNGVWRAGRESDPTADSSGANRTVSSYAVLDRLVSSLLALDCIEHVAVAGHSSGGQTVQRWAVVSPVVARADSRSPRLRLVVANPSSYVYFDDRRWSYSSPSGMPPWSTDELVVVNASGAAACPGFDQWEWGLSPGDSPPYVAQALQAPGAPALLESYAAADAVYLLGGNDTCNENLEPGCHSHGLETTCSDMLEGPFRLYRGQHYWRYLQAFYGRDVHSVAVVPNAGHDHTLIFQSKVGLETIFAPKS